MSRIAAAWVAGLAGSGAAPQAASASRSVAAAASGAGQQGQVGAPGDEEGRFVATVLGDTEDAWRNILAASGRTYRDPTLVLFNDRTSSPCGGSASTATGPFYCPVDEKIYVDLTFYRELRDRFHAPGDFAEAYVIAHEVGHHVQKLLGTMSQVDRRQAAGQTGAGSPSVRLELQADCYAGIWARSADKEGIVEVGDIDEALRAAAAVGDDNLQRQSQGYVVPDTFTHGTAEQRSRWFKRGYGQGTLAACDTFGAQQL